MKLEKTGVKCTNDGVGEWKNNFFLVFLKKKSYYCLEVKIISYLCIRKKFPKTGNFWKG